MPENHRSQKISNIVKLNHIVFIRLMDNAYELTRLDLMECLILQGIQGFTMNIDENGDSETNYTLLAFTEGVS